MIFRCLLELRGVLQNLTDQRKQSKSRIGTRLVSLETSSDGPLEPCDARHNAIHNPDPSPHFFTQFLGACFPDHLIHTRHASTAQADRSNFALLQQPLDGIFHAPAHFVGGRIVQIRRIQSRGFNTRKALTCLRCSAQICHNRLRKDIFPHLSSAYDAKFLVWVYNL